MLNTASLVRGNVRVPGTEYSTKETDAMTGSERRVNQLQATVLFFEYLSATETDKIKQSIYARMLEECRLELVRLEKRKSPAA